MTRALLGCTIVLTWALTAHAQSFDPLYKPKPGDEAMVGRPTGYNDHSTRIGMGFDQPKLSFFGDIGIEFPEMVTDVNRVTGHMEDGHTYLIKQGKRYRLHAGLKVGCPVCAHFVHYTSRRNRVPPRRGFRVEVQ